MSETRLNQTSTPLAEQTGCSDTWKDVLAVSEEDGNAPSAGERPRPLEAGSRACLYDVETDASGERFVRPTSSRVLSTAQTAQVNEQLSALPEDATCSRSVHTRCAVVFPAPANRTTLIALDGCAVQQDGSWWRGIDRIRAALSQTLLLPRRVRATPSNVAGAPERAGR